MNGWHALLPGPVGIQAHSLRRFSSEDISIKRGSPAYLLSRGCSEPGHRMKPFRLHSISFLFTSVMAICALAPPAGAEQPQDRTEAKKAPPSARPKPQVIYHVSNSDVAALHAQAKSQSDVLAVDGNMPTSLQMSRNAANEAAAKAPAPQQPPTSPNVSVEKSGSVKNVPKHRSIRPKESPRPKNLSPRAPANGPPRNPHAPKSHKK